MTIRMLALFCALGAATAAFAADTTPPVPPQNLKIGIAGSTSVVLVGAGDILSPNNATTATLIKNMIATTPGLVVFTAGDNAYPDGSASNFATEYDPTWGAFKSRTHPSPGNHDYTTAGAPGYYGYFGAAAHGPDGYYSYDLGTSWHIVALNSEIPANAGSPQETWLRADLAANTRPCTLAYWHRPRFSSGTKHGSTPGMQPLWQALYDHHAEIVVSGHEHNYERFDPQTPTGTADLVNGIREFVVGTASGSNAPANYPFGTPLPNSVVRGNPWGVMKFTLSNGSYTWEFVPIAGTTFSDSGSDTCH